MGPYLLRSWILLLSACCVLVVGATPLGGQPPAGRAPLQWGADAEGGAPYIFKDPADPQRNIGFEVDLIEALAAELQRPIVFHQYNYDSLISGLERGDFDFAMNGLEVTGDRVGRVRFSRPYYIYRLQLVARAEETRFGSLEDCRRGGLKIGTLGETAASRLLDKLGISAKYYDGQAEPYQDLELGRIDGVLLDVPIAVYYALPNPKLKFVGDAVEEGMYAIAFPPAQETLAREFDQALLHLAQRGELRRIYEKWRIWNEDQNRLLGDQPLIAENLLRESGQRWSLATYLPLLLRAAGVTIEISVCSMALAMAIGLFVSLLRLYGPLPLRWAAIAYVEFFRGIPVLLLLYLLYYGLPSILAQYELGFMFKPSDFTVAILAFGLNYAAYEAEIYRAGISAVPVGQWEAAASLGMSPALTFRRIVLPQALRTIIPPVTNDFVALFKDTSLVSVIAVVELTKQYQILAKSSLRYLEIGLVTAVVYLVMSVPLGHLSRYLEKRWGPGQ